MDKIELVERLIKDGSITLAEGLKLLETEKETVYVPNSYPVYPAYPFDHLWRPWTAPIYGTWKTTTDLKSSDNVNGWTYKIDESTPRTYTN